MADEITVTTGLRVVNSTLRFTGETRTFLADQTTGRGGAITVDVGTTQEAISFGDMVPGYIRAINLDSTNFVKLRFASGADAIKLQAAGGVAVFEIVSGVTLYAIADTAACKVLFEVVNS